MEMDAKRGGVDWRKGKICGQTCPGNCRGTLSGLAEQASFVNLPRPARALLHSNNQNEGLQDTTITRLYHQADRNILHTESPLMMAASFRICVCAVHEELAMELLPTQ